MEAFVKYCLPTFTFIYLFACLFICRDRAIIAFSEIGSATVTLVSSKQKYLGIYSIVTSEKKIEVESTR